MSKNIIIVECPHCKLLIEIDEINCAIFRHGIFKKNNQQINPHSSKEDCDRYVKNNLIIGCGKPFRLLLDNKEHNAVVCDYI